MRTVGEMLHEARVSKRLTVEQVELATKIRKKFLIAIESDDYSKLPSVSYAKGFVKNYSDYLGLNSSNMLAFFRRQTKEITRSSLLPKGVSEPLNATWFRLTPTKFLTMLVVGLVISFLLYFGLQYRSLQLPPPLTVDQPKENEVTSDQRVQVLGKTDSDATVTVNGVSVLIRTDGKFFEQVGLEEGPNTITIVATSRYGKSQTIERVVVYQPVKENN